MNYDETVALLNNDGRTIELEYSIAGSKSWAPCKCVLIDNELFCSQWDSNEYHLVHESETFRKRIK